MSLEGKALAVIFTGLGLAALITIYVGLHRPERVSCFTCIEACAPFAVAICEPYPAARLGDPITCACNPLVRIDSPPTIGPAPKGGR